MVLMRDVDDDDESEGEDEDFQPKEDVDSDGEGQSSDGCFPNCWQLMTSQDTKRVRRISSSIVYVPRGRCDIRNAGDVTFPV